MKMLPAIVAMLLLIAGGAMAQTTNTLSEAEIQGRALVQKILQQWPSEDFSNTGVLKIKGAGGVTTNLPITFEVTVTPTNWQAVYTASLPFPTNSGFDWKKEFITVTHATDQPPQYEKYSAISY